MKDMLKEYLLKGEVMKLLSSEELAQVSMAETASRLHEGQEYLDLEQPAAGVRRARGTSPPLGLVLPRDAVQAVTWVKILEIVGEASSDSASRS